MTQESKFVKNDYENNLAFYLERGDRVLFCNPDESLDFVDDWYEQYGEPENIAVYEDYVLAMYF